MLSLIVVHYATPETLAQTLAAFAWPAAQGDFETIVVDNASLGPSGAAMQDYFPRARFVLNSVNLGFGRAANQGAREAKGDRLLFLNGDCFLTPGQLIAIGQAAEGLEKAGAVGFRQVTASGRPQLTFGRFPTFRNELARRRWQKALDVEKADWAVQKIESLGEHPSEVDWVSGSCLWMPRNVFEQVEGFDERFFMYFEDIDICRRVQQQGWRVYYSPKPEVLHLHGASAAGSPQIARPAYRNSQLYFARKHWGPFAVLATRVYLQIRKILELP